MANANDDYNINRIKKIDFTKGFSSWHLKWPLKLKIPFSENMKSTTFFTVIEQENENVAFEWYLGIRAKPDGKFFHGLYSITKYWVPVIFRIALHYPAKAVLNNLCLFYCFHYPSNNGYGTYKPKALLDDSLDDSSEIIFHCWIDIPKDILNFDQNQEFTSTLSPNSLNLQLFEGVMGRDEEMQKLGDVTLILLDNTNKTIIRKFYCDRRILAARSDVFRRMFVNREWKEGESSDDRKVEITDIDEKAMEAILEYIYTNRFPSKKTAGNIIYAADKYNLPELVEWCTVASIALCCTDNLRIKLLEIADRHQLNQLKAVCVASMCTNLELFGENSSIEVSIDQLKAINSGAAVRQLETNEIILSTKS